MIFPREMVTDASILNHLPAAKVPETSAFEAGVLSLAPARI